MKKIILSTLAVTLLAVGANAQVGIGPEVGLNLSNLSEKDNASSETQSIKVGFRAGATADIALTDNLYLQPSIFFANSGAKSTSGGSDVTTSINSIEIPIRINYKLGDPGDNRFFFGIYPYLAYNVSAKAKFDGGDVTLDIGSDKDKDVFKAIDFGAGVNVGYQLSMGLFFRAHYQLGLSNLAPNTDDGHAIHSSSFGVSAGWFFNE